MLLLAAQSGIDLSDGRDINQKKKIHSSNPESIHVSFTGRAEEGILYNLLLGMNKIYTRERTKFISLLI